MSAEKKKKLSFATSDGKIAKLHTRLKQLYERYNLLERVESNEKQSLQRKIDETQERNDALMLRISARDRRIRELEEDFVKRESDTNMSVSRCAEIARMRAETDLLSMHNDSLEHKLRHFEATAARRVEREAVTVRRQRNELESAMFNRSRSDASDIASRFQEELLSSRLQIQQIHDRHKRVRDELSESLMARENQGRRQCAENDLAVEEFERVKEELVADVNSRDRRCCDSNKICVRHAHD